MAFETTELKLDPNISHKELAGLRNVTISRFNQANDWHQRKNWRNDLDQSRENLRTIDARIKQRSEHLPANSA